MEPLIKERMTKNIAMAVKAFLIEENTKEPIKDLDDYLERVDFCVLKFDDRFLRSVYERLDSFDELIWNYIPDKEERFEYWRTTLALDRGQELIKMDISNKLKSIQYEPEYDVVPPREKDAFIQDNSANWRDSLMQELGIVKPDYT